MQRVPRSIASAMLQHERIPLQHEDKTLQRARHKSMPLNALQHVAPPYNPMRYLCTVGYNVATRAQRALPHCSAQQST
jgi:hypothetical protein